MNTKRSGLNQGGVEAEQFASRLNKNLEMQITSKETPRCLKHG